MDNLVIRPFSAADDLVTLTELLHAAYAEHAAANRLYWATHQSPADTLRRLNSGQGFVAEIDGGLVGTVTVRRPQPDSKVALFADPHTWSLVQFGVQPEWQRRGIGRRLHQAAVDHARANGACVLALDTAVPATDLIAMYERWGYRVAGECDWRPKTNYPSVLMTLDLPRLRGT